MPKPLLLDFGVEPVDPQRVRPVELPPSRGNTPRTKHCGTMGAVDVQARVARQHAIILAAYRQHGPLSDAGMEDATGTDRSTVIPRRHELMALGLVVEVGTAKNPKTGINNTTFDLTPKARAGG